MFWTNNDLIPGQYLTGEIGFTVKKKQRRNAQFQPRPPLFLFNWGTQVTVCQVKLRSQSRAYLTSEQRISLGP